MDISEHFTTSDLLLETRECRVCGKTKNLLDEFYKSRKNPALASSYSYECKVCTLTVSYTHLTLPTTPYV